MDAQVRRAVAENEYKRTARELCDARIHELDELRKQSKKSTASYTKDIKKEKAKKARLTSLKNDDLLVFMGQPPPAHHGPEPVPDGPEPVPAHEPVPDGPEPVPDGPEPVPDGPELVPVPWRWPRTCAQID